MIKKRKRRKPKVVMLGPQAAGKGTQAHIISTWSGSAKLSMGDLLREIQKEDTERGRTVKELIAKGEFVPDDIITNIVRTWIRDHADGWVVEGFPRTQEQVKGAAGFLHPDAVFFLNIPDEDAKRRLSYRRVCSVCKTNYNVITAPPKNPEHVCDKCGGSLIHRDDDKPDVVAGRLMLYHKITEPIKQWYRNKGLLIEVNARPGIPDVAHDVQKQLEDLLDEKRDVQRKRYKIYGAIFLVFFVFVALVFIGWLQG